MVEHIDYKAARELLESRKKTSKFRNKAFWQDGIYWHSKREYRRWCQLLELEKAGEISGLRRQVPFDLHANGVKIAVYRADFVYKAKNQLIIEDVKAKRRPNQSRSATATSLYQRSKRHLKAEYGLDITEV